MPAPAIEQEMNIYFNQLDETQKRSVIEMLKTFLQGKKNTSLEMFMEEYNRELEEAEKEIESGHFILHEDLEKEIKGW